MPDPSAGEVGGIFAGLVTFLTALGAAIKWAFGRRDKAAETRSAKLQAWHEELKQREAELDRKQAEHVAQMEDKLAALALWGRQLETEVAALRGSYQLLASALRIKDPGNPALGQADELLKSAFPLNPVIPPPLAALLANIPEPGERPDR